MPTIITATKAIEESTLAVDVEFKNEAGNAVAPVTATWTLSDNKGNIINEREDEAISNPSSSETIVLSGDDLEVQSGERDFADRIFTLEWTYNSALGNDLPGKDWVEFQVADSVVV
jgi:hypothetical protein